MGSPTIAATRYPVGGKLVDAVQGRRMDVLEPATGTVLASAPSGGAEDAGRAVAEAAGALPGRLRTAPGERAELLHEMAGVIAAPGGLHADQARHGQGGVKGDQS